MIGSILVGKKPVVTVAVDTPVTMIAGLLHQHRIGAVPVLDGESLVGLVSERDITRCLYLLGPQVLRARAEDIMTTPVVCAGPRTSLTEAMAIMTDRRFRHLPVVESGQLLGLVSIGDLVKRRIEEAEAEAESLKVYISS